MEISRRRFLHRSAITALTGSIGLAASRHGAVASAASLPRVTSLADAGKRNGILVGSAVDVRALRQSVEYSELIRTQCSIVVAENAMKFGLMRPTPDSFFFDDSDFLVNFARRHSIQVRGHNFVWHRQLPNWFTGYATAANAEQLLVRHIETVGARYAGRIHSWDVCNEVIHLEDGEPNGLRNSPWYKLLGPGYIELAFRTARRVDPHALLCYNDYDVESEDAGQAAKRAAVLKLLGQLKSRGVPVEAMGVQGHIFAGPKHVYGKGLTDFMAAVQGMGLKLMVTEMDVNDRDLSATYAVRDQAVAERYGSFLDTALANTNVISLLNWGLSDKYTWLNGEGSRADHLPERCLPFNEDLQPVQAFHAELEALKKAPRRT